MSHRANSCQIKSGPAIKTPKCTILKYAHLPGLKTPCQTHAKCCYRFLHSWTLSRGSKKYMFSTLTGQVVQFRVFPAYRNIWCHRKPFFLINFSPLPPLTVWGPIMLIFMAHSKPEKTLQNDKTTDHTAKICDRPEWERYFKQNHNMVIPKTAWKLTDTMKVNNNGTY